MGHETEPFLEPDPEDPTYREMLAREAAIWANPFIDYQVSESLAPPELLSIVNELLTGRPGVDWLDDLADRGPFPAAATLGATAGYLEKRWLERRASDTLDLYELSEGVIAKTREKLMESAGLEGVTFVRTDLNFHRLPRDRYDVIWSAGALHHLVNLEHVCDEVHAALKPGGLFAFHEYVGDRRMQFDPLRIRVTEEALARVPTRFFRAGRKVRSPSLADISPFEAVRSDEIHRVVSDRFESLHWVKTSVLLPIGYTVDLNAIAAEAPELLKHLMDAEKKSMESGLSGTVAYGVFRRR